MRPIECVQPQLGLFRISTEKTCPNPAQAYEVYKAMHGWTVTIYKDSNMFIELPLEESNDHPEDADHEAHFIFPNLLGFGLWNLKQSRTFGTVSTKPLQALMLWRRTHTHTCSSITNHHVPKHDCDYHFCMASLPSWLVLKRYENNSGFWTILHVRKPMDGLPVVMSTRPFYVITVHAFVDANFDKAQVHMPKNKSICPGHRWRQPHWWGRPGMFCGG